MFTSKGKFLVLFPKIVISFITTSTSPVGILGLYVSSSLFLTVPDIVTDDSIGICEAKSVALAVPDVTT